MTPLRRWLHRLSCVAPTYFEYPLLTGGSLDGDCLTSKTFLMADLLVYVPCRLPIASNRRHSYARLPASFEGARRGHAYSYHPTSNMRLSEESQATCHASCG